MAFSVPISILQRKESHYSEREGDEIDEQKVNFKSQPNKEKSYRLIDFGNAEIGGRCISTGPSPLDLGIGAMA